jgi:hypothetical protein
MLDYTINENGSGPGVDTEMNKNTHEAELAFAEGRADCAPAHPVDGDGTRTSGSAVVVYGAHLRSPLGSQVWLGTFLKIRFVYFEAESCERTSYLANEKIPLFEGGYVLDTPTGCTRRTKSFKNASASQT